MARKSMIKNQTDSQGDDSPYAHNNSEYKRRRDGTIAVIAVATFIMIFLSQLFPETDILVAISTEIGIGASLAVIIYIYSRKNERKVERILEDLSNIAKKQEERRWQRKRIIQLELYDVLQDMKKLISEIKHTASPLLTEQEYKKQIDIHYDKISKLAEELDKQRIDLSEFYYDNMRYKKLKTILHSCKNKNAGYNTDGSVNINYWNIIETAIHGWIIFFYGDLKS